jgi:alanine racemase
VSFGARAVVRLDALSHNFEILKGAVPGSRVMAAVKANAYGHGLVTVSRALAQADALAVARLVEAQILRKAGIDKPVVLMGGVIDEEELVQAAECRCALVIHTAHQVELLESSSQKFSRIWLKIDTGMNRLGVRPEDASALLARIRAANDSSTLGLMTHLANSDDLADPMSKLQIEQFRAIADQFEGDISVANSSAILGFQADIDSPSLWTNAGEQWIRPGVSLFGVSPIQGMTARELKLQAVMQFESTLISVKPIRKGERVGYGGCWTSGRDSVLGIIAAGYADGYSRFLPSGTPVIVNGRRVPLAGVVSMDLCAVDLGPAAEDTIGDKVTLWGDELPVEEVAAYAKTTAYSLVCGITDRAGRLA